MAIKQARTYENVKTLSITCDENSKEYNDFMIIASETKRRKCRYDPFLYKYGVFESHYCFICR